LDRKELLRLPGNRWLDRRRRAFETSLWTTVHRRLGGDGGGGILGRVIRNSSNGLLAANNRDRGRRGTSIALLNNDTDPRRWLAALHRACTCAPTWAWRQQGAGWEDPRRIDKAATSSSDGQNAAAAPGPGCRQYDRERKPPGRTLRGLYRKAMLDQIGGSTRISSLMATTGAGLRARIALEMHLYAAGRGCGTAAGHTWDGLGAPSGS